MVAGAGTPTGLVWRRGLQRVVDTALVMVLSLMVLLTLFGAAVLTFLLGAHGSWLVYVPLVIWVATIFLGELYVTVWFPYRRGGTTPAMRWLKLRVVLLDGGRPQLKHYFVRWLLMAVDGLLFCLVGAVLIAMTGRRQRLGDIVAGTTVVRVDA